jgi:hypothetical protein
MKLARTKETQHIHIDVQALKAFLLEQHFTPAFVENLHFIVVPFANSDEVDDATADDLVGGNMNDLDAWIYTKGKTIEELNWQVLREVRSIPHEFSMLPSCGESLDNFDAYGDDTNNRDADILNFVAKHQHHRFITMSEGETYPLAETI